MPGLAQQQRRRRREVLAVAGPGGEQELLEGGAARSVAAQVARVPEVGEVRPQPGEHLGGRAADQFHLPGHLGQQRRLAGRDAEIAEVRHALVGAVPGEVGGVGDQSEPLVDSHGAEAIAGQAHRHQVVETGRADGQRQQTASAWQVGRHGEPLVGRSVRSQHPGGAVGLGLHGGEAGVDGEPRRRVIDVVAGLAQERRQADAGPRLHPQDDPIAQLQLAHVAQRGRRAVRIGIAPNPAQQQRLRPPLHDALGLGEAEVAGPAERDRQRHAEPPPRGGRCGRARATAPTPTAPPAPRRRSRARWRCWPRAGTARSRRAPGRSGT